MQLVRDAVNGPAKTCYEPIHEYPVLGAIHGTQIALNPVNKKDS